MARPYQIQPRDRDHELGEPARFHASDHALLTRPCAAPPDGASSWTTTSPLPTSRASSPALRSWSKRRSELQSCITKLGNQGKLVQMQLEQLAGASMETEYNLMIRDYAADASEENSRAH
ncbi:MAG: hypothetical protein ACLTSX_03895 [Collinsella sp.]